MPMTDASLSFSTAQAVTSSAISSNVVDLTLPAVSASGYTAKGGTSQPRDIGGGADLTVLITVDQAATAAGAATVQFQVIVADTADLATNPQVVVQSDVIGKASLVAGAVWALIVNTAPLATFGKRFIGVNYSVGTGPLTAGKFTANLVLDDLKYNSGGTSGPPIFPSGFSVK